MSHSTPDANPAVSPFPASAEAAAPEFTMPLPLERTRRVLALFNNSEFEFDTLSFIGPNGGPLIVIDEVHDSKGQRTQPHPLRWYVNALVSKTREFYEGVGAPAIVLVHFEEGGHEVWKAGATVVQTMFDPKDKATIERIVAEAQGRGENPNQAIRDAIDKQLISRPTQQQSTQLIDVPVGELPELFANHVAPPAKPPVMLGFAANLIKPKGPVGMPNLPKARPARMMGGWSEGIHDAA